MAFHRIACKVLDPVIDRNIAAFRYPLGQFLSIGCENPGTVTVGVECGSDLPEKAFFLQFRTKFLLGSCRESIGSR